MSDEKPIAPLPKTLMGFDWGLRRIGVAIRNTLLTSSTPLGIVQVASDNSHFRSIAGFINCWKPDTLILGNPLLPTTGNASANTHLVLDFAESLRQRFKIPLILVDERYSTCSAINAAHTQNHNSKKHTSNLNLENSSKDKLSQDQEPNSSVAKHMRIVDPKNKFRSSRSRKTQHSVGVDAIAAAILLNQYLSSL